MSPLRSLTCSRNTQTRNAAPTGGGRSHHQHTSTVEKLRPTLFKIGLAACVNNRKQDSDHWTIERDDQTEPQRIEMVLHPFHMLSQAVFAHTHTGET